jgi:hypothetical protein
MTLSDSNSQAGTVGNQPAASAPQNVQPSSETVTITKAQWDAVEQKLQRLESGTQSEKDRAVRKTNERMDRLEGDIRPMLERALQHTASGKTAAEALNLVQSEQDEYQTRQALAEFAAAWKSGTLPAGFGAGTAGTQGVDVAQVLAEYQLDPKDPYVAGKLAGQTFTTKEQAELAAARILRDKITNTTNPAQQSAITGLPAAASNIAAKIDRLAAMQRQPTKFRNEISQLVKELEAEGWGG